mmetsp:Transcript_10959/g.12645  ORF Transcript_10959/g.12645 Transcript_10959/m.12645 type:complete len:449 (+) Transcript_10959:237-1583(+)|eukprot:CAMPEP_0184031650 /NCGR_PEP_ID=MMETSP0955-20130417/2401_1 /TAXON_ID=627963 /ORGANISM="Aplanochytrium sp, Strain PBS07" /LENGTH=448 /DNA_ID=CAMNT_0026317459 /DNA_START=194 /DNA_END=1540 /DNA_ORIENTATION=+
MEEPTSPVVKSLADVEFVFFDLDDCLYQNDYRTERILTEQIGNVMKSRLNMEKHLAKALYLEHGTTIRGLLNTKKVKPGKELMDIVQEFHDVDLSDVKPAKGLRDMIQKVKKRRFIFTASIREHAEKCLERLGIADLFENIIDAHACKYYSKHSDQAFRTAMNIAGVKHAHQCVLMDDSMRNISTAYHLGWHTVCVGKKDRDGNLKDPQYYDFFVDSVLELPSIAPELFKGVPLAKHTGLRGGTLDIKVYSRIVFVLGGPGSGKGTLCSLIEENLNAHHISVPELVDAAKAEEAHPYFRELQELHASGQPIPAQTLVDLILHEISLTDGRNFFLDDFPQNEEQLRVWFEEVRVQENCQMEGALVLDCPDEVLEQRLLARGEVHDSKENIANRIDSYHKVSNAIVAAMEVHGEGRIWNVDSNRDPNTSFADVQDVLVVHLPELSESRNL